MCLKMRNIEALVLLLWLAVGANGDNCEVSWISTGHQVAESQYLIDLSVKGLQHGMAITYFPDTQYDIIIRPKKDTLTFKEFHFKMENEDKSKSYGTLDFGEPELTRFSGQKHCINQVVNSVLISKPNITIAWQSPPRGSGCIKLIAHVKETDLRYHTDELKVCEDERIELDDPGTTLLMCNACEYAKYEMTFEGKWSKFTHPRGFPKRDWLAGFPIVVGASHTPRYEIWSKYKRASEGLTNFAVTGSSLALELELKQNLRIDQDTPYPNITTLIKFRGTNFRNTTLARAQLKVDRMNHVVSLLAKIYPSPDWFIGVSSLELCTKDGKWMEEKKLNLYAYDVGAKTGLAFEQENNYDTWDVINPMNISWPVPANGTDPPFYDKYNNTHEVRPMAQIHLRRIRIFGSTCGITMTEQVGPKEDPDGDFDCATPWTVGECSTTCGIGFQNNSREFLLGHTNETCKANLQKWTKCEKPKCPDQLDDACDLMPWSEWGKCTKHCGQEYTKRDRNFKSSLYQDKCKEMFKDTSLTEYKDCGHPPCPGGHDISSCNNGLYSNWTTWTPCSVTVGQGLQYRSRTKLEKIVTVIVENDAGFVGCMYDKQVCEGVDPATVTQAPMKADPNDPYAVPEVPASDGKPAECRLDADEGEICEGESEGMVQNKWYYDLDLNKCEVLKYSGCGGNKNRFDDEKECIEKCGKAFKVDCKLGNWGEWSKCDQCKTTQTRIRAIEVENSYHGKRCPASHKIETKPCEKRPGCV